MRLIVDTHESKAVQRFLPAMAETAIKAVNDTYLKVGGIHPLLSWHMRVSSLIVTICNRSKQKHYEHVVQ